MRFYAIEMECDYDDPDCHRVMLEAAQEAARTLRAQSSMLAGRHMPVVRLKTWSMYESKQEVPIDEAPGDLLPE